MQEDEKRELIGSLMEQARPLLVQKEYRKAIEQYTKALEVMPTLQAFEARGIIYNIIGMRQEAVNDFLICLHNNFEVNDNLFHLGLALRGLGQLEDGLNYFTRLIELDPGEIKYWYERGRTNAQLRRYKEGLADLEQVGKMDPDSTLNIDSEVIERFKTICQTELTRENEPDRVVQAEEFFQKGLVGFRQGDINIAMDNFLKAIKLDPFHIRAYKKIGHDLYRLGQNKTAISYLKWPIFIDYADFDAHLNRSGAYFNLGEYELTFEDAHLAIQINPDNPLAYLNRGNAYGDLGKPDLAIADYEKVIELDPDFADAYFNRGIEFQKAGEYPKAIADITKALELNGPNSHNYLWRGKSYLQSKNYDAAIQDYSKVLELTPDDQDAYRERGQAYLNLNQFQEAWTDLNQAVELNPEDAFLFYLRGLNFILLNRKGKAIADLKQAANLDPENLQYRNFLFEVEAS